MAGLERCLAGGQAARIALTMTVESDGRVSSASAATEDIALAKCLGDPLFALRFPTTNGRSTFRFPIRSGGGAAASLEVDPAEGSPAALARAISAIDIVSCKSCVAERYRTARVAPFSGKLVTVGRTFRID